MPKRHAFTLVELLVVIGIIAVLVAILLPALNRAREQARSVQCLSNLRQLGMAFTMYTNAYKRFPRSAVSVPPLREDWFHWKSHINHDLHRGGIAEFMSQPFNVGAWRCPSDVVENHARASTGYLFSYSVNFNICVWESHPFMPGQRTLLPTQIRNASEKILIIDESSETVDDGAWAYQWSQGSGLNVLSNRHVRRSELSGNPDAGFGNVCFADGHADRIDRARSYDHKHYDPFYPGSSPLSVAPGY